MLPSPLARPPLARTPAPPALPAPPPALCPPPALQPSADRPPGPPTACPSTPPDLSIKRVTFLKNEFPLVRGACKGTSSKSGREIMLINVFFGPLGGPGIPPNPPGISCRAQPPKPTVLQTYPAPPHYRRISQQTEGAHEFKRSPYGRVFVFNADVRSTFGANYRHGANRRKIRSRHLSLLSSRLSCSGQSTTRCNVCCDLLVFWGKRAFVIINVTVGLRATFRGEFAPSPPTPRRRAVGGPPLLNHPVLAGPYRPC